MVVKQVVINIRGYLILDATRQLLENVRSPIKYSRRLIGQHRSAVEQEVAPHKVAGMTRKGENE